MSLWIKICANTSLADALLAANAGAPTDSSPSAQSECGADAVGFVFAPSPRRVTVAQVAAIVPHLPAALEKIGVFVDAPFHEIAATVEACGLTGVQIHFAAPPDLPARLRGRFGPDLRIVRTIHFDPAPAADPERTGVSLRMQATEPRGTLTTDACFSDPDIDAVLVDSRSAAASGGTGRAFDWRMAAATLLQNPRARERCIAAGGLTSENVAEAIATLRPWGVDVASGVEAAPGRKDPAKLRAFILNARRTVSNAASPLM